MKGKVLKLILLLSFVCVFVFGIDTNAYAEIYDGAENVENNAEENKEEKDTIAGSVNKTDKSTEQNTSLKEIDDNSGLQESQLEGIKSESSEVAYELSSESIDENQSTESESSNNDDENKPSESGNEDVSAESIDGNIASDQSSENVNGTDENNNSEIDENIDEIEKLLLDFEKAEEDKKNKEKNEGVNGQLNGVEDKEYSSESLNNAENKKQNTGEKVTQDYIGSVLRAPKKTEEKKSGKWIKDSKGYKYKLSDGSYLKNEWLTLDGNVFHFDKNGYMEKGWKSIDSKWYYFSSSGYMQTGMITVKGKKYLLADNGVMLTGWRDYNNERYFFADSGEAYCSAWKQDGKVWRYLDEYGKVDEQFDSKLIIDVSEFQDPDDINYDELSEQITGVIIRAGGTYMTSKKYYLDSAFETHYKEFKRRNIPVGTYWFSCATNAKEGLNEAKYMHNNVLKGHKFELPIFWDTEDEINQRPASRKNLTEAGEAFLGYLTDNNYKAGIYASASWLEDELDMDKLDEYDVWVAHYDTNFPNYDGEYEMHQYTGSGRLKGYNSSIDISRISVEKDYPTEIKNAKLNGYNELEWFYENNNWYCKDGENNLQRGWITIGGYWYYLNDDYTMFRNGWLKWNGKWYYMYKGGSMASNKWVKWNNNWYYLYGGGSMASDGWLKWNGKWYYMYTSGSMASDEWVKWNGKWYYMYNGGSMASDEWVKWNGKWYYLTGSGAMLTNGYADGYYVNGRGEWVS